MNTRSAHKGLALEGGPKLRTNPFPPWPVIFDDQKQAVMEVLTSGKLNYWTGSSGVTFQNKLAEYTCTAHTIVLNSGTSALHSALAAAQVGPGDEVIVPSRTFVATAAAVIHQNAVPIFADIDPNTYTISAESVRERITERTRAVIPVAI